jgi:mono/diheme cytochrome c family protein
LTRIAQIRNAPARIALTRIAPVGDPGGQEPTMPSHPRSSRAPGSRFPLALLLPLAALVAGACASEGGIGGAQAGDPVARGGPLFDNNCAVCHGPGGSGTSSGPPLVHVIYEPGHHPDESFQRAVAEGVAQHHWEYGPMPAIPGLDRDEVADITAYVRQLQREAGITG